jgi:translocation and assembly module TamA
VAGRGRLRWQLAIELTVTVVLCTVGVPASALADVPYETHFAGSDDEALVAQLNGVSQLVQLQAKPPDSEAGLRRRAEEDLPRLKQAIESQGYWEGDVTYAVALDAAPAVVTVTVTPGPLYRLGEVKLVMPDGGAAPELASSDPATFGLSIGDPARSGPVLDAEGKIVDAYGRRARPFAKIADRKVVVDRGTKTMSVTYTVEPGPRVRFGDTTLDGLTRLNSPFVERRIAWAAGQDYDTGKVEATSKSLTNSGLFSSVRIDHADAPDAAGAVAMRIVLVERRPRSVGAGLSYNTSEGFGANAFWEHRNLFGGAEKLRIDGDVAQQRRDLRANFRSPDLFGVKDRDLTGLAEFVDEDPVAYTARRELVSPGVEQRFSDIYTAGVALQVQHARVTEASREITQTYSLAGVPLFLHRDTRDDILNPQKGSYATFALTPNTSISGTHLTFLTSRIDLNAYRRIGESDRTVIAGFLDIGSIVGEARDTLPADQRIYAGGGGSLRGYGYQLAGPLGPGNKPLGGRSLLQFGGELRLKITDAIGIVPFLEAGNVFEASYPNFSGGLLYDTGIGLRYYTPVGPLRFDIATPLRRREGDAIVQLYISIGQAF